MLIAKLWALGFRVSDLGCRVENGRERKYSCTFLCPILLSRKLIGRVATAPLPRPSEYSQQVRGLVTGTCAWMGCSG